MVVIKSLEKHYLLKNAVIPKYFLDENSEFIGIAQKNQDQGLELDLSAKAFIQNDIPKFEGLMVRNLIPSRHP
jgi:hypothetical protein